MGLGGYKASPLSMASTEDMMLGDGEVGEWVWWVDECNLFVCWQGKRGGDLKVGIKKKGDERPE